MPRARYRRVRTPEGAKRYGVPIGSIIRVDRDHDRPKKDTDDEKRPAPSGGSTPPPKDPPKPPASPTGPDDEDDGTEDVDPEEALDAIMDLLGPSIAPASPARVSDDQEAWKDRYRSMLENTSDSTGEATAVLPTDLVARYAEYDREETGGEALDMLTEVIRRDGIRSPLRLSTDGRTAILHEGNHRLAAARRLGIEEVPVHITLDREVRANEGTPVPVDADLMAVLRAHESELRDFHGDAPSVRLPAGPPKGEVPDPAAVRNAASDTAVQQLLADQIDGRYDVDGEDVDVHVSRVAVSRNDAGDVEGFTATLEYSREGRGVARSEFSAQVDEQGMELSDRGSLDNPTIEVDGTERLAMEFLLRELTPQLSEHFNRWPEMGHDERAPIGTGRAPDYLGHPNDPAAALFAELAAADEDDDIPRYKQLNRQIRQLPEGEAFRGEAIHSAEQRLQEAASEAGMPPEQLVEIANGGLTQFLEGRQLAITVRTDSLQAIVEDGRFRSQREPGAVEGGAIFDPKDREQKENGWFGEHDWPPIYAYVRDPNGARSKAQGYGSVTFVLDDRVRERATVSVTDSLVHWRSVFPGPANAPGRYSGDPVRAASSGARTPEEYANYLAEGSRPGETSGFYRDHYVEAQIHGGVPLSDVSEVVFAEEETARLYRAMLERAGLSFRVESPHAFDGGEPEEREWDA